MRVLAGEIGGTNARLAIVEVGIIVNPHAGLIGAAMVAMHP